MEVDVLRQEVHFFLKQELSNGLLSLREEFLGSLSDLLQRVGTGPGTSHEVLTNLDHTSKKIVKDAIEFYVTTKTDQLGFALESLGGFIQEVFLRS
jgi:hypothetical protein